MLYVADDNDNDNATEDADIVHHLLRTHALDNVSTLFLRKTKLHYHKIYLRPENIFFVILQRQM